MGSIAPIPSQSGSIIPQSAIEELHALVKGTVIVKGQAEDAVYRAAIDRFNKATISEAAIIVFVEGETDIAAALKYAQKWDLEITIACGRHSYYGASSTTGGLVVDLKKLKKVEIDVEGMRITAGGGCQAVDLEAPLQELGLSVVMGAANDTGIGGLTLGGGSGFLTGQYGLVIDNLIAARVVLADGRALEASKETNSDLFWAIRGGGSNFGVVTEFKYKIHKQGDVFFGPIVFTPDRVDAFLALAPTFQKLADASAGKLAIFMAFIKAPGMPSVHPICLPFYDGPESTARELFSPLLALNPVADMAKMHKYAECTMDSPEILGPLTHQHYSTSSIPLPFNWDANLVAGMVKDWDDFHTRYGAVVAPSKIAIEIRSYAKSASVAADATALRARAPGSACMLEAQHDGTVGNEVMREEIKKITEKVRREIAERYPERSGSLSSNPNFATGRERADDVFGENVGRLREVKGKYDPNFVFRKWFPIKPAENA